MKGEDIDERQLFFLRSYEDQYTSVIEGDWQLIKYHSGKYELYKLKDDENEKSKLNDIETKKFKHLAKALNKWKRNMCLSIVC